MAWENHTVLEQQLEDSYASKVSLDAYLRQLNYFLKLT